MNKKKLGTIHYFPIEFPHLEIPKMVEILEKFSNSTHNVKTDWLISYRYQYMHLCRFRKSNLKKNTTRTWSACFLYSHSGVSRAANALAFCSVTANRHALIDYKNMNMLNEFTLCGIVQVRDWLRVQDKISNQQQKGNVPTWR